MQNTIQIIAIITIDYIDQTITILRQFGNRFSVVMLINFLVTLISPDLLTCLSVRTQKIVRGKRRGNVAR